jgi:hypothetical protein
MLNEHVLITNAIINLDGGEGAGVTDFVRVTMRVAHTLCVVPSPRSIRRLRRVPNVTALPRYQLIRAKPRFVHSPWRARTRDQTKNLTTDINVCM